MKLLFGTGGSPLCSPTRSLEDGMATLRKLKLDALELEFVQQVFVKEEKAGIIKKLAEKENIALTCHGQYYINLNSLEQEKVDASKQRILKAATIAGKCGAKSVTFHPAFYQGIEKEKVYAKVKKELLEVQSLLPKDAAKIRPETTGKPTQFGSIHELIRLGKETGMIPCVDFAHLHAREGKQNSVEEFRTTLALLEKELDCLKNMHIHMSGIAYGDKGEKHHLLLEESDFNWKKLLETWKEFDIKGIVICESPEMEKDALLMKNYYENL